MLNLENSGPIEYKRKIKKEKLFVFDKEVETVEEVKNI
jgi:hypothetical protein